MISLTAVFTAVLASSWLTSLVESHGRLIDPPNRGSIWRFGFNNPVDVQDHELNCGGQKHQWNEMNGRCGLCGDPYDQSPRAHEAGGKYANGIIVAKYVEGASIRVTLGITAPHKGWFEFRICPVNNAKVRVTQSCLDKYLLKFSNGQSKYYLPKVMPKNVTVGVRLPTRLTCSQCVLQWKYHTGKDWGCDKPGVESSCCIGCGPQEEFYGCADVSILRRGAGVVTRPTVITTRRTTAARRTTRPTTRRPTTRRTTTPRPTVRRTTPRRVTTRRPISRRTTRPRITTTRPTFIWERKTTTRPVSTTKRPPTVRSTTTRSWWKKPTTYKPQKTKKPTTGRRYFTKKPTTRRPYNTPKPTTRRPFFRRTTTRAPQKNKFPTWTWKVPLTTKKPWWQYRYGNDI